MASSKSLANLRPFKKGQSGKRSQKRGESLYLSPDSERFQCRNRFNLTSNSNQNRVKSMPFGLASRGSEQSKVNTVGARDSI